MSNYYSQHCSFEFDEKFNKIEKLRYLPWVGINYASLETNRVLIVGESIYDGYKKDVSENEILEQNKKLLSPEYARWVVKEQGLHFTCDWSQDGRENGLSARSRKLTDNFSRALFGEKHPSKEKKEKLWSEVGFAELIQNPLVSRTNRAGINRESIIYGYEALEEVIQILEPTKIIFIGNSNTDCFSEKIINYNYHTKISGSYPKTGQLNISGKHIPFVAIMHTSCRNFSWSKWNSFLNEHKFSLN